MPRTPSSSRLRPTSRARSRRRSAGLIVPATSGNLGPGFDSLGLALDLHNEAIAEPARRMALTWEGEGAGELPPVEENLVIIAYREAFRRRRRAPVPLSIHVTARIPVSRGMGSSAAAIAMGLSLARPLLIPALTLPEAAQIGSELEGHPDNVIPALVGGITAAVHDKEGVHWVHLGKGAGLVLVIFVPPQRLATKKARAVLPKKVDLADAVFNLSRAALLAGSLATGKYKTLGAALGDRLHQPYRAPLVPGLELVLAKARQHGAYGAFLSGAGPCIGVLCPARPASVARTLAATLLPQLPAGFKSMILPVAQQGAWS